MSRYVMANRRAGKLENQEKIRSRESLNNVISSSFMTGASVTAMNEPEQETARRVVMFEAEEAEINAKLDAAGFWERFPPEGTEVVSWYVMMGIGQVVTLKVPAAKLRDVNLAIEQSAWGAFDSEFFPTYDFRPVWQKIRREKSG